MTKWQMLSLIFNSIHFSRNFIFFLLPKDPFIHRSNFLSRLPGFIRVLSKVEYIWMIQNGGANMTDGSCSFLVINDVIITFLLLLRLYMYWPTWFYQTLYHYLISIFRFIYTLRESWILPYIQQYDVIMTSENVILSIKLYPEVGNCEYIILCNFGCRGISGFEVIEETPSPSPVAR